MWVLWMNDEGAMGIDARRAWPMLMRWCIRQQAPRDKMGSLVYEAE